jgi:hypothetical protein
VPPAGEKFASFHLFSFFASGSWGSVPLAGFSNPSSKCVASFSRVGDVQIRSSAGRAILG